MRYWNLIVAASLAIVLVIMLAMGIGWLSSSQTRVTTYAFRSPVRRVELRLASGTAVIAGSSSATVQVQRTDNYSFGHAAREQQSLTDGVLRITSSCPRIVVGSCSASYGLAVPETVAVDVETAGGDIRLTGFRGRAAVASHEGGVDVEAYCGFDLSAASVSGDVHVAAACSPRHLSLRSQSGDVTALVPPGRYRISATGAAGRERVSGVARDERAPFTIDAHSGTGAVAVEGGL